MLLFRLALAVVAAITCCVAGWAALLALGKREPVPLARPVDVDIPAITVTAPRSPLLPPWQASDASAARSAGQATERPAPLLTNEPLLTNDPLLTNEKGAARVALRSPMPDLDVVLCVRSGWSHAPLARRAFAAGTAVDTPIVFAGLPHGEHVAVLAPATAEGARSYLARARLVVPAPAAVDLDTRVSALRVVVRDAGGAAVPHALVQLARSDDPAWVAPMPAPAGFTGPITDAAGSVTFAPLGAGVYRVSVIGDAAAPVEVRLPDAADVTLTTASPR